MLFMSVTWLVIHREMSELRLVAWANMQFMLVTLLVIHVEMSEVKLEAR
jgi:hypothetical protein